jgi:antitoxin component YwqK of YwqJK toxin-antitoxin module
MHPTSHNKKTVCHQKEKGLTLASINIIDRNGFTETIGSPDRLKKYSHISFLDPQPYQKVLRVFKKDPQGHTLSIITAYHSNGEIKQYLEVMDGRAHGLYMEWHENGKKKLQTRVAEGNADIDELSQVTWSLTGKSQAWNEDGQLTAEIMYDKGVLTGVSNYFHANGNRSKCIPYEKGKISGTVQEWYPNGSLCLQETYIQGEKQGEAYGYWNTKQLAFHETYKNNLLIEGEYFTQANERVGLIVDGNGTKCIFNDVEPIELHEYVKGKQEGMVTLLDNQSIHCTYHTKNGQKQGPEIFYYTDTHTPKLSIEWDDGKINGIVKTWYHNGAQESQREMSQNKKQGMLTAWYMDGSLMLVEEYDKERLVKGDYLKKGERIPYSRIINGSGTATFFDSSGNYINRVEYKDGSPIL